jgi:hypothetical protein
MTGRPIIQSVTWAEASIATLLTLMLCGMFYFWVIFVSHRDASGYVFIVACTASAASAQGGWWKDRA